jgi:20S proteasome alpha/beta subunit
MYIEDVYTLPGMTLGIAIAAGSGVVLASDSQETRSDRSSRPGIRKILTINDSVALAFSGTGNVAKGIVERKSVLEQASSLGDPNKIADFLGSCFLGHMQGYSHRDDFFIRTYHLKDGMASKDVLDLSFVLAAYRGAPVIGVLGPTTGYSFSPMEGYASIGVTAYADAILPTLLPLRHKLPTVQEAKTIAAFCLAVTADRFDGVGEPFDFVVITKDGAKESSTDTDCSIMRSVAELRLAWKKLFTLVSQDVSDRPN